MVRHERCRRRQRLRFDPPAGEEASSLGRLTILRARMNPDLGMGDVLLKKTGSGDLFMVFGERDLRRRRDRRRPSHGGMGTITVLVRAPARGCDRSCGE